MHLRTCWRQWEPYTQSSQNHTHVLVGSSPWSDLFRGTSPIATYCDSRRQKLALITRSSLQVGQFWPNSSWQAKSKIFFCLCWQLSNRNQMLLPRCWGTMIACVGHSASVQMVPRVGVWMAHWQFLTSLWLPWLGKQRTVSSSSVLEPVRKHSWLGSQVSPGCHPQGKRIWSICTCQTIQDVPWKPQA